MAALTILTICPYCHALDEVEKSMWVPNPWHGEQAKVPLCLDCIINKPRRYAALQVVPRD